MAFLNSGQRPGQRRTARRDADAGGTVPSPLWAAGLWPIPVRVESRVASEDHDRATEDDRLEVERVGGEEQEGRVDCVPVGILGKSWEVE